MKCVGFYCKCCTCIHEQVFCDVGGVLRSSSAVHTMGAAWCRDRAAAAHNSKSPLDRVIVQCVSQICPGSDSRTRGTHGSHTLSNYEISRARNKHLIGQPVPVHTRSIKAVHAVNALTSWQDASLRVPDSSDESGPPVPPPRKKKILREQMRQNGESWKQVQRPPPPKPPSPEKSQDSTRNSKKRREKTLSSVSLPNYNDLSLSVYSGNNDKSTTNNKSHPRIESCISLPGKGSGLSSLSEATVEKIENCVRRCRSFGAFKPEPLKLKTPPLNGRLSSESDDSFDGLDDWDLRVIEHCDAHEISPVQTMLPPQRQRKSNYVSYSENRIEREHLQTRTPEISASKEMNGACKEPKTVNVTEDKLPKSQFLQQMLVTEDSTNITKENNQKHETNNTTIYDEEIDLKSKEDETCLETMKICPSSNGNLVVYDFVNNDQIPENINPPLNGFPEIPQGMKTPPPSPESIKAKLSIPKDLEGDQIGHSSLLRLLKEYQTVDGKMEDTSAQSILTGLGIPPTLKDTDMPEVHKPLEKADCGSRGSSGRSSMTPSLSELEAALSDLLEASAAKTGVDEDEEDSMNISMATTVSPVQQSLRVISPKPYSSFSNSFHPIQNPPGKQVTETTA